MNGAVPRHDGGPEIRWAILVSLPVGYKGSQDYIPFAEDDGVTPLTFETEGDARAAAAGPKHAPVLARIDYPWRIAAVPEPFPGYWPAEQEVPANTSVATETNAARAAARARAPRTGAAAPLDLMAAYDSLGGLIGPLSWEISRTSIPVVLTFVDTCVPYLPSASRAVPTDIACALWAEGLVAVRGALDAALDPSRQADAISRLGLPQGFRPNVAVMVYHFWPLPEVFDGELQRKKRQSYEPRTGVPHMLQEELRAHGCVPVIAELIVFPWTDRGHLACMVRPHYARPSDNL